MTLKNELTDPARNNAKLLGAIADLLKRKNIDVNQIGDIKRVSIYQSLTKNEAGEAEIHDLSAIQFAPSWETGPAWPVVQPGPVIRLAKPPKKIPKPGKRYKTCVVCPDIQFGFFRHQDGHLEATHDEKAISIFLQIVRALQPDFVVMVGDNLDLPEMGKYLTYPAYQQTTQASINRATLFCAELQDAAPHAKKIWLAGNHEERMPKYIAANAVAAYGLRKGNTPASWPVMSVPYLCRMDEYGIEYRPGYPASDFWINEKLRVIHGDRVKSAGSTAHIYLNNEKTSVIYGHIHRIEVAYKTREDYDGHRTIMAASPGCLARIDGAVPSVKGGVDLDGRPLTRYENWQQGLAVVQFETSGLQRFSYDTVAIYNGWARYQNVDYNS